MEFKQVRLYSDIREMIASFGLSALDRNDALVLLTCRVRLSSGQMAATLL